MTLLKDVAVGELTYNGWTFDAMHKSKFSNNPALDDAGRVVKWQEVTIEVEADVDLKSLVDDGTYESFSAAATALLRALSEPGAELIYIQKGAPDLYVNSNRSSVRDVNWGPKPQVGQFTPIGGIQVVHLTWKVVAHVVHCAGGKHKDHVLNLTFDAAYNIDSDGYLELTINGGYEIPLTYSTNRGAGGPLNVIASADEWWKKVSPPTRVGFQRITRQRRVSKDRRRVDYTITDKELPVPLPADCTMMEAKHRVRGARQTGFSRWNATISATVRTNPRLPRSVSWDRFMLLVASRINWARPSKLPGQALRPLGILLADLDFEEDVLGRDNRFSVSYQILGASLKNILYQSGLWLPIPGTDHARWTKSMKLPHSPHGLNGSGFGAGDDVMIDLCHGATFAQVPQSAENNVARPPFQPAAQSADHVVDGSNPAGGQATDVWFAPENSWLNYTANLWFAEDDHVIRHKPLKGKVDPGRPKVRANGSAIPVATQTEMEFLLADWDTPDILQTVCSPDTSVVLYGTAMRLGYKISPPRLVKFGGADVTQVKNDVTPVQLGAVQGIPIWGLAWEIEYALTEPAKEMPTLANPLTRVHGSDAPADSLSLQQSITR